MTIREFLGWVLVIVVLPPLGLLLVVRYRVIQNVIAGYRGDA
jgi:hypothetical protein